MFYFIKLWSTSNFSKKKTEEHDIYYVSFRFQSVPFPSLVSPRRNCVPLTKWKRIGSSVKCCHRRDCLTMLLSGLAKEDWTPTETTSLMPRPALPCRVDFNISALYKRLSFFLRCHGSNVDSSLKIFTSECRNSKWTRPSPLNRLSILEDNRSLVPLVDNLINFQCKDRIPNAMTAKLLCTKLEQKAKLTFLQQLFMKYSCK